MNDQLCNNTQNEFICRLVSLAARKSVQVSNDQPAEAAFEDEIKNTTDTFRWLRNQSVRLNESTKDECLESGLVETCLWYCDHYFTNEPLSRSILLQFLANFSINHENSQQKIFQVFHKTLRNFILSSDDPKLLNNSLMLLYNLCLYNVNFRLDVLQDATIIQKIMAHWTENEIEYSKMFLDSIFSNSKDFIFVYTNLPDSAKDQLMNLLSIWLDYYKDEVSLDVIIAIKDNYFIECTIEEITTSVVNVLAKASNVEKFNTEIQKHTSLLHKLMDLLTVIHERSKNSVGLNNEFSRVKDLSALFNSSDVQTHNRFWFKSDIIRLIANMCYNHQEHQNLMRTNHIIPILLECCSFDAKNPLMREWSLFALRNILEGNLDNQNFVANIDSVGSIDPESSVMLTDSLGMAMIDNSISNNDTMFI